MQVICTTWQQMLPWIKHTESYKMCLLTKCSWRCWLCLCFHLHILLFYCFVSKFLTRIFVMVLTSLIYCDNIWKHLPVEILYLHVLAGIKITILLPTLWILPLFIQARDKNVIEITEERIWHSTCIFINLNTMVFKREDHEQLYCLLFYRS